MPEETGPGRPMLAMPSMLAKKALLNMYGWNCSTPSSTQIAPRAISRRRRVIAPAASRSRRRWVIAPAASRIRGATGALAVSARFTRCPSGDGDLHVHTLGLVARNAAIDIVGSCLQCDRDRFRLTGRYQVRGLHLAHPRPVDDDIVRKAALIDRGELVGARFESGCGQCDVELGLRRGHDGGAALRGGAGGCCRGRRGGARRS